MTFSFVYVSLKIKKVPELQMSVIWDRIQHVFHVPNHYGTLFCSWSITLFTASRLILVSSVTEHVSVDQHLTSIDDTAFVSQFLILRSKLDLGLSH